MGYFGILMATMQMTHVGEIFVIVARVISHGAIVPFTYYIARGVSSRVSAWVVAASSISLGLSMDLSPILYLLNISPTAYPRGIRFPFDQPSGTLSWFFAPGLGLDSFYASFHHLAPILLMMFIVGLLLRWNGGLGKVLLISVVLVELPFFHLAIGTIIAFPIAVAGVTWALSRLPWIRTACRKKALLRVLALGALASLLVFSLFLEDLFFVTVRYSGPLVLLSLVAFLCPLVFLALVGYRRILRQEFSLPLAVVLASFEFVLLTTLVFSISRDSGAGLRPMDYFVLFPLQAVFVVCFVVGISLSSPKLESEDAKRSSPDSVKGTDPFRLNPFRDSTHSKTRIGFLIAFIVILLSSAVQVVWILQVNHGGFELDYYGSVPITDSAERSMFDWIHSESDLGDVILTHHVNWELCSYIGRQIVYSGYREPVLSDPAYQAYVRMYNSTSLNDSYDLFVSYGITYVVVSPMEREDYSLGLPKFYSSAHFLLAYDVGDYSVFRFAP
jgi:hypothetical protein